MFFGTKSIDLSESITEALEALRQALEVLYGLEVCFRKNLKIRPGRGEVSDGQKTRSIMITGQFCFRNNSTDGLSIVRAEISVSKTNESSDWHPNNILHLEITKKPDINTKLVFSYVAHWGIYGVDARTVRVTGQYGDENWQVGHGIYDRHSEPILS